MNPKPPSCQGCDLLTPGLGFVQPSGSPSAGILFLGESPGSREIELGYPFAGPAGGKFHHLLYRLGRDRKDQRVHNIISCRPPEDSLHRWPGAITHCRPNLDQVLEEPHPVVVTLGALPTEQILHLDQVSIKDFHGTVSRGVSPRGREFWVVPTFHPSYLVRGAHNLEGTVYHDLNRAFEVAEAGWEEDHPTLQLDPDPAFFSWWVDQYLAAVLQDPLHVWLSVDVETADKETEQDEGELKSTDRSMQILRWNFSYDPDEGLTVPSTEPYLTIIRRLLLSLGPKWFWNKGYDLKRIWRLFGPEGILGDLLDGMDAWHALHSDVPKGLGFVAPLYSRWGPWKHLAHSNPVLYGAGDGLQNQRCAYGVAADLHSQGMWNVFWRHMHEVDRYALRPSCEIGVKVDPALVEAMRVDLREKSLSFYEQTQELVPDDLKPLHPRQGWVNRPGDPGDTYTYPKEGEDHSRARPVLELRVRRPIKTCFGCGAIEVYAKHRCKDADGKPSKTLVPNVVNQIAEVSRYFVREDFNPGSWQQVLAYIKAQGHKPGKLRGRETTNRETIERLAESKPRNRRDEKARELYSHLLDYRDVKKVLGTYVEGTLRRLEADRAQGIFDDRLRPTANSNPSTLRIAYNNPNLQNVVADRKGGESLAAGFRRCIVAGPGQKLVELDWSAIEAVIAGWCMGDPEYIKLAWLGVHDYLCSHAVHAMAKAKRPLSAPLIEEGPASLDWPVDRLLAHFARVKGLYEQIERDQCKRTVHGTNYLLTAEGMYKRFRKLFSDVHDARKLQELYVALAPKLRPWQQTVQDLAYRNEYVGGAGAHPFGYRHEFYNVREFRQITEAEAIRRKRLGLPSSQMNGRWYAVEQGEDAKRSVAFWPQSIAAGVIRETSLRLFKPGMSENYIGNMGEGGRTPLRAIIHDSFLLEIPEAMVAAVIARVVREMTRAFPELHCPREWGIGEALQFGVSVKIGDNWKEMKKVPVDQPWLALLKGTALPVVGDATEAEQVPIDEVEDDEMEDYYVSSSYLF